MISICCRLIEGGCGNRNMEGELVWSMVWRLVWEKHCIAGVIDTCEHMARQFW